ncbi:MAG: hypothetical protein AB7O62_25650 [Pirellulales bacterium]
MLEQHGRGGRSIGRVTYYGYRCRLVGQLGSDAFFAAPSADRYVPRGLSIFLETRLSRAALPLGLEEPSPDGE